MISNQIEELLGAYWDCAYQEGHLRRSDGDKANQILHDLKRAIEAEAQKVPEGYVQRGVE